MLRLVCEIVLFVRLRSLFFFLISLCFSGGFLWGLQLAYLLGRNKSKAIYIPLLSSFPS